MPKKPNFIVAVALAALMSGCDQGSELATVDEAAQMKQEIEATSNPTLDYVNASVADGIFYTSNYFEHDGVTLHYVEAGSGDLIIFYHGFPSYWLSFFDQMEAFKSSHRVVAIDGLGAGLSDKPDDLDNYKIAALSEHIDALATHVAGDSKFTLIGHDWGGALAMAFAEDRPERLNAVASFNAPSVNIFLELLRSNEAQQATSQYMAIMSKTPQQAVRDNPPGERIWTQSYGGLLGRGEITQEEYDLFGEALRPAAATNGGFNWYRANVPLPSEIDDSDYYPNPPRQIEIPALLVWGTEDRTFVPEFIDMMRENITQLEVVIIEGANHWTTMSHPDESTAAIRQLLEGRAN